MQLTLTKESAAKVTAPVTSPALKIVRDRTLQTSRDYLFHAERHRENAGAEKRFQSIDRESESRNVNSAEDMQHACAITSTAHTWGL